MSEWQPIETAPKDETAVLVYCSRRVWTDWSGKLASFGELRDHVERFELGFYQNGTWLEANTAHDMFESWQEDTDLPTHWMPLPPPPSTPQP